MKRSEIIQMENKDGIYYLSKNKFFHGLKRRQQRDELSKIQAVMPLIRDDADLILKLEPKENSLHDGNGDLIGSNERGYLLDEMIGRRDPLRGENLDNEFHLINGIWIMNYNFRNVNGAYQFEGKEINPLLQDGYITLNDLDEDGLAKKVGSGLIYYIHPRNNCFVRLGSIPD
ncbi:MAG: hypothetical protein AABX29_08845, partial [Nanoarchaeota archaeon]